MMNFNFHEKIETLSQWFRGALRSEETQKEPSRGGEGESGIMRIGVISDTHGQLRPEVLKRLEGCDYILHAGDFDREDVLESLLDIAPVLAVRGNNDWGRWADRLPRTRRFTLDGEAVQAHEVQGCLTAIPVSAGAHQLDMRYIPAGLIPGAAISAGSLALCLVLFRRTRARKRG